MKAAAQAAATAATASAAAAAAAATEAAERANEPSLAEIKEWYPTITSIHKGKHNAVAKVRTALTVLGESTTGSIGDLRIRLQSALGLQAKPTNFHQYNKQRKREHEEDDDEAEDDKPTEEEDNKKPPKPKPKVPKRDDEDVDRSKSAHESPWTRYVDSATEKPYWHNSNTGEFAYRDPLKPRPPSSALRVHNPGTSVTDSDGDPGSRDWMSVFARSLASSGANITLVAPGAYASGCTVHQHMSVMPPASSEQQQQQQQQQFLTQHQHHQQQLKTPAQFSTQGPDTRGALHRPAFLTAPDSYHHGYHPADSQQQPPFWG